MKTRKWYSIPVKPDSANELITMTDMEDIHQAIYEKWIEEENIIKWMKV